MSDSNGAVISAKGLTRYFQRGSETVKALDGVDLELKAGELVSILGPSGSGKTTLINLLACLDAPTSGDLTVAGKSVAGLKEEDLVDIRRGTMGFVFQKFHLIPTLNVVENVELPLLFLNKKIDRAHTMEVLKQVGLEQRATHLPRELSGGQMQRVAVARALVVNPKVLIADEPTGNLDKATGESIFELFQKLAHEKKITVLLSTHNLSLGLRADRIISLEDGKIVKEESGRAA